MLALFLEADLTGVTDLRPDDTPESPYYYTFRVQCTSCREVHPNWESNELSGSRGEANFVWRCKSCKRESSATVKEPPAAYKHASPPTRQKILEFDCRGLEFVEFKADVGGWIRDEARLTGQGEWLASGLETTSKFTGIDLQEDWYDYDELAKEEGEVSIREIKWAIGRA